MIDRDACIRILNFACSHRENKTGIDYSPLLKNAKSFCFPLQKDALIDFLESEINSFERIHT